MRYGLHHAESILCKSTHRLTRFKLHEPSPAQNFPSSASPVQLGGVARLPVRLKVMNFMHTLEEDMPLLTAVSSAIIPSNHRITPFFSLSLKAKRSPFILLAYALNIC